jgi:hypothetical protein
MEYLSRARFSTWGRFRVGGWAPYGIEVSELLPMLSEISLLDKMFEPPIGETFIW